MFFTVEPLSWQYFFEAVASLKLVFEVLATVSLLSATIVLLVTFDFVFITFVYAGTTGDGDTNICN